MTILASEAPASTDDRHRQALQRLTLMLLGGLGCTMLIVVLLVGAALQAVDMIDTAASAHEKLQVERAVALFGGDLNYVTLDAMRHTLDLAQPRLVTRDAVRAPELSVGLGGDRVVAWMPQLFGAQTFGQLAPIRIGLGLVFVLIVAVIAFHLRRVGQRLEHKRREATQLALTDSLTGLGNRLAFESALDARLATGESFALVLADLDRLKAINDALGHAAGDVVLRHVAKQLREAGQLAAARLGGDEFAVLCPPHALEDYVGEVNQRLRVPLLIDGREVSVGVSFGVARSTDFERSADALMRAADAALYRAKRRGGAAAELATPLSPTHRSAA